MGLVMTLLGEQIDCPQRRGQNYFIDKLRHLSLGKSACQVKLYDNLRHYQGSGFSSLHDKLGNLE